MRTKHYVPDLQKVVIASAASRTGHCEEAEGRRGNLFLSFPRRRESIFTTYESRDFAFHFFPFRPMAFTSYPQGHRSCLLDEAGSFVLFCLGRGLLPHPARTLFTKFAKWPGCFCRQISIPDYSCFSLSTRRPGKLTPPPLFLNFVLPSVRHFFYLFRRSFLVWCLGS